MDKQEAEKALDEAADRLALVGEWFAGTGDDWPSADDVETVGLPVFEGGPFSWAEVGRRAIELLREQHVHEALGARLLGFIAKGDYEAAIQSMPAIEAWEIDGGPGGIYWEVGPANRPAVDAVVQTRREAAALGASVFHTVAEWEAENAEDIPAHVDAVHAGDVFPDADGLAEAHRLYHEIEAENAELEAGRELEGIADLDERAFVAVGIDRDAGDGHFQRCGECSAVIIWHKGPQYSGWRATNLDGHLRDICYRGADRVWVGHAPAGVK